MAGTATALEGVLVGAGALSRDCPVTVTFSFSLLTSLFLLGDASFSAFSRALCFSSQLEICQSALIESILKLGHFNLPL